MSIKLCSIEIENFKVYSGVVKVESLKQFNVLTGTNGSGKFSSISMHRHLLSRKITIFLYLIKVNRISWMQFHLHLVKIIKNYVLKVIKI